CFASATACLAFSSFSLDRICFCVGVSSNFSSYRVAKYPRPAAYRYALGALQPFATCSTYCNLFVGLFLGTDRTGFAFPSSPVRFCGRRTRREIRVRRRPGATPLNSPRRIRCGRFLGKIQSPGEAPPACLHTGVARRCRAAKARTLLLSI